MSFTRRPLVEDVKIPQVTCTLLKLHQVTWQSLALSESSSDDSAFGRVVTKLQWLLDNWPLRPVPELELVGLHGEEMKTVVRDESARITALVTNRCAMLVLTLKKQCKEAKKLLGNVDAGQETHFRKTMGTKSAKLASKHKQLKEVFDQVHAASTSIGKSFRNAAPAEHEEARMTMATSLYNVCVYTAVTLYRSPTTWKKTKEGQKALGNLKTVLATLGENPDTLEIEIDFAHDIVQSMRSEAAVPRPEVPSQARTVAVKPCAPPRPASEEPQLALDDRPASEEPPPPPKRKRRVARNTASDEVDDTSASPLVAESTIVVADCPPTGSTQEPTAANAADAQVVEDEDEFASTATMAGSTGASASALAPRAEQEPEQDEDEFATPPSPKKLRTSPQTFARRPSQDEVST
jgi:hypothetical protein